MKKILLITITLLALNVFACKANEQGILKIDKITALDTIYTLDSLSQSGFKKNKTYNVDDLPKADSAYFGWKEIDSEGPKDFEVRIYKSHEDAVTFGRSYAEEAAGKDAVIRKGDASWKEGIKDRRIMVGGSTGASGKGGGAPTGSKSAPKYGDYIIYGNLIILCEGRSVEQAIERCSIFIRDMNK